MAKIWQGRYTAQLEGDFVVFIIGMRINQLWAVHKWLPVARAMRGMLAELAQHKELGLLHVENALSGRTTLSLQYWRSAQQLHAYAHLREAEHLPAWTAFNRRTRNNTAVAVYHETYLVPAGAYECIYVNAPRMGLARASQHVPAIGRMDTMRSRLSQPDDPLPPAA